LVYATSKSFMDYFGINTSDDLPKIKEVFAEQLVLPTLINENDFKTAGADKESVTEETAEESNLSVNETGNLTAENQE
jgi:segregation and condensation protein B